MKKNGESPLTHLIVFAGEKSDWALICVTEGLFQILLSSQETCKNVHYGSKNIN
jgi:hypothetical protein